MSDTRKRVFLTVGGFGLGVVGLVASTLVIAGIGALVWWLGVASSGTAGAGDLTRQRNSARNITQWSTTFSGVLVETDMPFLVSSSPIKLYSSVPQLDAPAGP
ncbi:MAG TPA: hypothetical protein VGX23_09885 [Actinocrinis sp.]|nr:hypothetical protein [Actinocrinis sp.]